MLNKNVLTKTITSLLQEHKTPSVQLAIIKDGEIILNEGYGYRDYKNKIKTDEDTVYAIGSTTKAFTATAVAKLVSEGKLNWDSPVKSYLPEFEMYDDYATKNLTVRDILCHRCGLPRHDMVWYFTKYSSKELIAKLKYLKPSTQFRDTLQYQNLMYALAGYLIEKVTGKRWCEYIDDTIVKPLGMEYTVYNTENAERIENRALPYQVTSNEIESIPYYYFEHSNTLGAAGSMYSNAKNMLKWMELNINKGIYKGKEIIAEKEITECHTPQMINKTICQFGFKEESFQSYGLGWFIDCYRGHKVLYHGGNIDGFSAMVAFIPSINTGFTYLTNCNETKVQLILKNIIFDMLLGYESEDWNTRIREADKKTKDQAKEAIDKFKESCNKKTQLSLQYSEYEGKYSNPAYGDIEIILKKDSLIFKSALGNLIMKHMCVNTFSVEATTENETLFIPIEFKLTTTGSIESVMMKFEEGLANFVEFKKKI